MPDLVNKLLCGNCLDILPEILSGSVNLIIADLPYGKTRNAWDRKIPLEKLWPEYERIISNNGAIILFADQPFTSELVMSNTRLFRYSLVYNKTNPSGFLNAGRMPLRYHEDILVFYKKLPVYNPQMTTGHKKAVAVRKSFSSCYGKQTTTSYESTQRYPSSIIKSAKDPHKHNISPTQKPLALLEYLIKTYSNPGDIVLDNVMGSGSTIVAAINTGRRYIGMEIDDVIYEKACIRVNNSPSFQKVL